MADQLGIVSSKAISISAGGSLSNDPLFTPSNDGTFIITLINEVTVAGVGDNGSNSFTVNWTDPIGVSHSARIPNGTDSGNSVPATFRAKANTVISLSTPTTSSPEIAYVVIIKVQ